ncbi:MAG: helix-turn-helix transcriptional regulator [Clostridia bacterium]|nr:helix-turn-helix transcriptional regulator [Clostridia bacterium]
MEYFERIRQLREDLDLRQKDLGKQVNMSQRKISNIEVGKSEPSIGDIKALCKFFDVSSDYLLGLTDDPKK